MKPSEDGSGDGQGEGRGVVGAGALGPVQAQAKGWRLGLCNVLSALRC